MDSKQHISDEKDTIQKLIESEERWRSITKYTPDHILMMDRDAKILFINYTVPDLSIDEVIGRPIFDFVPEEYQDLHRNVYDELLNNGELHRFETGYVDKDGKQFYFEIHSGPVWKEGKIVGIINRSTDITERKITEQKLKESEARLKKLNNELEQRISERTEELRASEEKWKFLSENSPAHIMLLDKEHKILFINRTLADLSKEEVIGRSVYSFVPQEFHQTARDTHNSVWETGRPVTYSANYITKEGEILFFDSWIGPVFQSGEVVALVTHSMDVTKKKQVELKLKESEEKWRSITKYTPDNIMQLDLEGNILFINHTVPDLSIDDVIGKSIYQFVPEKFRENMKNTFARVLGTGKSGKYETGYRDNKGNDFFFEAHVGPILDSGQIIGFIARSTDMTNRKKAERKLKESEEKWKAISENSPAHIMLLDGEHKILFINRTAPDLSKEEVIGSSVYAFIPQEFRQIARDSHNSVWETSEPVTYSTSYITKEGDARIFDVWIGPVFQYGKVSALVSHSMDVTANKEAERKLKESEEKFRGFLDFGNIGMAITSIDKKWVYCNDQICEMLGFTREELFDKTWADLTYPGDLQSVIEQFNNILDGIIDSYQIDKRFIKKNGEIVYVHLTVSCIRNSDGTVKHFLGTLQNITERKKIELRLIESEEKHRTFMETAKDFMHIIDDKGKIIYANRGFIGYKKEELMEMHITELIAEETLPIFAPELKNLIKNGRITLTDLYCKGKDGTKIIGGLNVVAMYGPDGVFNGARGIFKDIPERKKTEQRLKESEEKYRTLFESSKDGIIFSNMDGKIMDCNQAYLNMLGYTLVEIQE
ncbi:MAG TPA: PAS domain S-box protein, partial [bacterium]|nr:PAS domain S-box protein [bacterium]